MSLNIKTSTGLLEIGGKVTEEQVISALGYVPANEPLIGTTAEITPTQVAEAIAEGRPILIEHTDSNFGRIAYNYFLVPASFHTVSSSTIFALDSNWIVAEIVGYLDNNIWELYSTTVVPKEEIDAALSNKADKSHLHTIANITNLQSTLDAKVPTSRTINSKALTENITLSASDVGADISGSANNALDEAKIYTDNAVAQKTQVQFIIWEADD